MVERLNRGRLVELIGVVSRPKGRGYSSQQLNDMLLTFCVNCPDPVGAMDLVVESLEPMSDEQLVDKALAMPPRDPASLPPSRLAPTHPLRSLTVDP